MMQEKKRIPLIAVVGPTASGKTALAVALAKVFDGEVISADSMQIYRRMEIATAKPTREEMQGIPHHLIDFAEPDNTAFSVADYTKLAHDAIAEVSARGKLPVLAGGTGLYVNAVIDNLDLTEIENDPALRRTLHAQAAERGNEAMLEELRRVDPALAEKLHPNNLGRILRALEVYRLTGIPMSEHQRRSRLAPARYLPCVIGITFEDRSRLYERINRRVDGMLAAGLVEEAREISRIYGGTAMQAIGYKELQPYLDGEETLENCVGNLKQATRRYAKRQLSWFRRDERVHWLLADHFDSAGELAREAENVVHKSGIICYN
ncbi:tRNA (adenosine(37)-N6)-dimethylallyltransferase MiaA [Anaerotruncus rubiinfantis]|uniref:tRNA (adenosine(37)-N6)-dimethylallyltransferase MiaA n=1 Tax=Anaerotruncus rubiinfantis TaxID=1720200 RepID=UPI0034A19F79